VNRGGAVGNGNAGETEKRYEPGGRTDVSTMAGRRPERKLGGRSPGVATELGVAAQGGELHPGLWEEE